LPFPVIYSDIKNLVDFVLVFSRNLNWRRRRYDTVGDGVWMIGLEEGNVKNRMNFAEGSGKFESSGVTADGSKNFEGAKSFRAELLGRSFRFDILAAKPDLGSYVEGRGGFAKLVGSHLILKLASPDLFLHIGVEFGEGFCKIVSFRGGDGFVEGDRNSGVIAIVGKERRDLGCQRDVVVVGELG
jgi:hypothetical protein